MKKSESVKEVSVEEIKEIEMEEISRSPHFVPSSTRTTRRKRKAQRQNIKNARNKLRNRK